MGQALFLTQQLDVFAKVLAKLFNLENVEDLEPALEFVQQHIDIELLSKLRASNSVAVYNDPLLRDEIEFLIYLKFTEAEILEKSGRSSVILEERSHELLEMMNAFLNTN